MSQSQPELRLLRPVEEYLEGLDKLSPRTFVLLEGVTEAGLAFSGPEGEFRGRDAFFKILAERFDRLSGLRYKVQDFCWSRRGDVAYVRLSVHYKVKTGLLKQATECHLEGIAELEFSPEGKIAVHREFWSKNGLV